MAEEADDKKPITKTNTRTPRSAANAADPKPEAKPEPKADPKPELKADPTPDLSDPKPESKKADADADAVTAEQARNDFNKLQETPPDPLDMHTDKSLAVSDQQSADAISAAYTNETTDLSHMGFQTEQFDSSGSNLLTALASPPQAALRAQEAVERRQGIKHYARQRDVDGTAEQAERRKRRERADALDADKK